jgi:hypothetical protein
MTYKSAADFLLNAPREEKIALFTEAAHMANEDQIKLQLQADAFVDKYGELIKKLAKE